MLNTTAPLLNEAALYDVSDERAVAAELVRLRAAIAELKNSEKFMADLLKAGGPRTIELDSHNVTVTAETSKPVASTDWAAVAEKLEPSRQLVTAHTDTVTKVTKPQVRTYGRKS